MLGWTGWTGWTAGFFQPQWFHDSVWINLSELLPARGARGGAGLGVSMSQPVSLPCQPCVHSPAAQPQPLGFLIDSTPYKLPNWVVIAVRNGTLKDSISVDLPLINIGFLSLDLIYLPLEQVHYYVLGRYDIFMEIWGLFVEYIKIK